MVSQTPTREEEDGPEMMDNTMVMVNGHTLLGNRNFSLNCFNSPWQLYGKMKYGLNSCRLREITLII